MFGVLIKHLLLLVSFFSFFSHFCGWLLTLHLGFLNEKKIWCFRCCSTIFFALLENQYSTSIKQFHSGNAPKYSLLNFSWLKEWFTNFLMLPVRSKILLLRGKHQHLLNVARCSFFTVSDSGSQSIYGENVFSRLVFLLTTHLLLYWDGLLLNWMDNMLITQTSKFLDFCFDSRITTMKIHPCAIPVVFLDYPPGMKGFCLYNITNKKLFISINLVFL